MRTQRSREQAQIIYKFLIVHRDDMHIYSNTFWLFLVLPIPSAKRKHLKYLPRCAYFTAVYT